MHDSEAQALLSTLRQSVSRLLDTAEVTPASLVVAYSGGIDSSLLLYALATAGEAYPFPPIHAVHVHHGLSPNADSWVTHCEVFCQSLGVTFHCERLQLQRQARISLEADARNGRYEKLLGYCRQHHGVLLLGQHQDDQLETILLQLKRGAGPKGLAGMAEFQLKQGISLLRPMLSMSRSAIEQLASCLAINWIEDESNTDTAFDRNFLRQQIIPQITERWPSLASTASRSAALCAEQEALLDEVVTERLHSMVSPDGSLSIPSLLNNSTAWQRQLVRRWLADAGAPLPSLARLNSILAMCDVKDDSQPVVELKGGQIRRFQAQLYWVVQSEAPPMSVPVAADQWVSLPWWHCEVSVTNVSEHTVLKIVTGMPVCTIKPVSASVSKKLKVWLKVWGVPPWLRASVPVVMANDNVVAVILSDRVEMMQGQPCTVLLNAATSCH